MDPWGTPALIDLVPEHIPLMATLQLSLYPYGIQYDRQAFVPHFIECSADVNAD